MRHVLTSLFSIALLLTVSGCGNSEQSGIEGSQLTGTVSIDGSSTVFPITEAVAEEFQKVHPRVRVTVGISGTGGGFKKFTSNETDINDASRPIKQKEVDKAREHGIEYIELPVAYDGISVVVNPENDFVDALTMEELKQIWHPESKVKYWSDIRPEWPKRKIRLYGPGTDSGTFDYFTKVVNGREQLCRADFTASEDDNVLVQGIAGDPSALGFFGFAYYAENQSRLKLIPIDNGDGPIAPSFETINNGTYKPLSRPIFIYVSAKAAERNEVQSFVTFYLDQATTLVSEVGYVPLPDADYQLAMDRFTKRVSGSIYTGHTPDTATTEKTSSTGTPGA